MRRPLPFTGLLPLGGCVGEIGLVEGLAAGFLALAVLFVALLFAAPEVMERRHRRTWREMMRNRRPWSPTDAKPRSRRGKRA